MGGRRLTWDLQLSLSLQEVGICDDKLLRLQESLMLANSSAFGLDLDFFNTLDVEAVWDFVVASEEEVSGQVLGSSGLTSTSRTLTPPMIATKETTESLQSSQW